MSQVTGTCPGDDAPHGVETTLMSRLPEQGSWWGHTLEKVTDPTPAEYPATQPVVRQKLVTALKGLKSFPSPAWLKPRWVDSEYPEGSNPVAPLKVSTTQPHRLPHATTMKTTPIDGPASMGEKSSITDNDHTTQAHRDRLPKPPAHFYSVTPEGTLTEDDGRVPVPTPDWIYTFGATGHKSFHDVLAATVVSIDTMSKAWINHCGHVGPELDEHPEIQEGVFDVLQHSMTIFLDIAENTLSMGGRKRIDMASTATTQELRELRRKANGHNALDWPALKSLIESTRTHAVQASEDAKACRKAAEATMAEVKSREISRLQTSHASAAKATPGPSKTPAPEIHWAEDLVPAPPPTPKKNRAQKRQEKSLEPRAPFTQRPQGLFSRTINAAKDNARGRVLVEETEPESDAPKTGTKRARSKSAGPEQANKRQRSPNAVAGPSGGNGTEVEATPKPTEPAAPRPVVAMTVRRADGTWPMPTYDPYAPQKKTARPTPRPMPSKKAKDVVHAPRPHLHRNLLVVEFDGVIQNEAHMRSETESIRLMERLWQRYAKSLTKEDREKEPPALLLTNVNWDTNHRNEVRLVFSVRPTKMYATWLESHWKSDECPLEERLVFNLEPDVKSVHHWMELLAYDLGPVEIPKRGKVDEAIKTIYDDIKRATPQFHELLHPYNQRPQPTFGPGGASTTHGPLRVFVYDVPGMKVRDLITGKQTFVGRNNDRVYFTPHVETPQVPQCSHCYRLHHRRTNCPGIKYQWCRYCPAAHDTSEHDKRSVCCAAERQTLGVDSLTCPMRHHECANCGGTGHGNLDRKCPWMKHVRDPKWFVANKCTQPRVPPLPARRVADNAAVKAMAKARKDLRKRKTDTEDKGKGKARAETPIVEDTEANQWGDLYASDKEEDDDDIEDASRPSRESSVEITGEVRATPAPEMSTRDSAAEEKEMDITM
jgi:hypothetical protein